MQQLNVNNKVIEVYSSIEELPIFRYHKFNKCMLIDSGIGSDLNDVNNAITKAQTLIGANDLENANIVLNNLRNCLFQINEELSPKHLAFVALIKSINGKETNDLSDEGLKKTLSLINDTPKNTFDCFFQAVKKKIEQELNLYFPAFFDSALTKIYFSLLKKRAILQLDAIIEKQSKESEIEKIDAEMISLNKPRTFPKAEIDYDKQFNEMLILVGKELGRDASKMSVFEFYHSLETLKNKK